MKNLFTVLFLVLSMSVFSQITFENTYDNGSIDFGQSLLTLNDGYLICGATYDDANGDFDIFATKVDLSGVVVWTNIYTSVGIGNDYATYMNETSDGNFVITGTAYDPEFEDQDAFVLKISGNGNELWVETYDGGDANEDGANYIVEDAVGALLVCGYATEGTEKKMWLLGLDQDGTKLGERFYSLNGDDEANCVIEFEDGSYALIGKSYDNVNGDYDGVLVRTDSEGNEIWSVFSIGTADEEYNDFVIDANGNYIITGSMEDEEFGDNDLLLMSVSNNGNFLNYSYTFDYQVGNDVAHRIYINNSDYFLAGSVEDVANGDLDAYLAKINVANGSIIGDEIYGGSYDDVFSDFGFANDGGYICVGYSMVNSTDADVYLVKTDENGGVVSTPSVVTKNNISYYPNPANEFISINTTTELQSFEIVDITGKILLTGKLNNSQINLSSIENGVYFIRFYDNKGIVKTEKLIINK